MLKKTKSASKLALCIIRTASSPTHRTKSFITSLGGGNEATNQVRLQLFALAYNLGNFLRRLALPRSVKHWSLTTLREKLIKIGAKVVTHARYVTFQMAEVAISRRLFKTILRRISRFGPMAPAPT